MVELIERMLKLHVKNRTLLAARPWMESCGIDVYATARNSGIELNVATRTDAPSKYINLVLAE